MNYQDIIDEYDEILEDGGMPDPGDCIGKLYEEALRLDSKCDKLNVILEKAKEVRDVQKQYFRTRLKSVLADSKKVEKELDTMIENYYSNQQELF